MKIEEIHQTKTMIDFSQIQKESDAVLVSLESIGFKTNNGILRFGVEEGAILCFSLNECLTFDLVINKLGCLIFNWKVDPRIKRASFIISQLLFFYYEDWRKERLDS